VDCRRLDDLDAVFEFDTCDDLRQLICVFQSPLAHIPFWSNRGIPKGLRIDDSGGIDSVFFGGPGCRDHILMTCGGGRSKLSK
jgi:hypothetical protein